MGLFYHLIINFQIYIVIYNTHLEETINFSNSSGANWRI